MKKQIIISIISFLAIIGIAQAGNYIVQKGDTLSQLALDSGNSVESIVVANNIKNPDLIYAGQSLNIPNLLGGNTPFRPSEFTTTLATSLTEGHSGTTLKVNSITTKDGQTLSSEILGDVIVLHINSGKSNAEIVKCTGLTTATRTFTGCTFGYRFDTNTTATANIKAHSQGETVIISNDDLYLTTQYPTIDGTNIFLGNNYIASSTQDIVKFYMTTSTDIYLWANKATGQFGYSTTSNEYAFNSNGTTFSAVNPMNLTSGELKLATSTAWFNLVDNKLSVATSTTSNFSLAWNDKWLATSTIPNLTMGNATTTGNFVIGNLGSAPTNTLSVIGNTQIVGNATTTKNLFVGNDLYVGGNITANNLNSIFIYASSSTLKISSDSEEATTAGTSYGISKSVRMRRTGKVKVKFDLKGGQSAATAYGRLFISDGNLGNEYVVGTERSDVAGTYVTFSQVIDVLAGNEIELQTKSSGGGSAGFVRNFRIYYDVVSTTTDYTIINP